MQLYNTMFIASWNNPKVRDHNISHQTCALHPELSMPEYNVSVKCNMAYLVLWKVLLLVLQWVVHPW